MSTKKRIIKFKKWWFLSRQNREKTFKLYTKCKHDVSNDIQKFSNV